MNNESTITQGDSVLKKTVGIILFLVVFSLNALAEEHSFNCYSIVAGKNTTVDGSVLFGHNEDNARKFVSGMWRVDGVDYTSDAFVKLENGTRIPQVARTSSFLWLQMPEREYSDGLVNEYGVAIVTDNCPSREDNPELTSGGIGGPVLRRLVIERAKTAREGVEILGQLIDSYGYTASGRTMIICDGNEGWLVAMVNGKHWVAQRVPDDEVAMIANTYTITTVDLSDTENFLGSADIINYAVKRGWYDPKDGPFSFEAAYADPDVRMMPGNTHRHWSGLRHVVKGSLPLPEDERPPFSVTPKKKLDVNDIAAVLRDHYEGASYETTEMISHKRHTTTICQPGTNSSSIFQLRADMPVEIGTVWWLAMWQPCSTPYMPVYLGSLTVPPELGFDPQSDGTCPFCVVSPEFGHAYRVFSDFSAFADKEYVSQMDNVRDMWSGYERSSSNMQTVLEESALKLWESDRAGALELITRYSHGAVSRAVRMAEMHLLEQQSE